MIPVAAANINTLGINADIARLGGFNPLALFAGGVQGVFYDPSDPLTLFSDRAGTTPCGIPGQGSVVPVGLMLDKSQGLVLGSELVTNGDFSGGTTTGWAGFAATLAVVAGELQVTPTDAGSRSGYQFITTVIGGRYRVSAQYRQGTATGVVFRVRNSAPNGVIVYQSSTQTSVGTFTFDFTAGVTDSVLELATASGNSGNSAFFDNVSVKQVAGNHALAANDTTARPELRARVNLLTYSEQFDNAAWTKTNVTVTANAAVAPDGTTTADLLQPTATSGSGTIAAQSQSIAGAQGTYTATYRIKPSGFNWAIVAIRNIAGTKYIWQWFDLASPAVGSRQTNAFTLVSATIAPTANGYYVCTLTVTTDVADSGLSSFVGMSDANNNFTATASGSNGLLVWGAQLTATNEFPANTYQRIVDANTYDAVGFPRYFVANGTSSAMSTPGNIPFATATSDGQASRNLFLRPTGITGSWNDYGQAATYMVANSITAPDGSNQGALCTSQTGAVNHFGSGPLTYSFFVKQGTSATVSLGWAGYGGQPDWLFTFATQTLVVSNGWTNSSVQVIGNGWFRISATIPSTQRNQYYFTLGAAAVGQTFYVWGAQVEVGSTVTAFQTTGTDKMTVFAGVRKIGTGIMLMVETSADSSSNNGSLGSYVVTPGTQYAYSSKGTAPFVAATTDATTYTAPVSNVLTGISDISGDSVILRLNGAQIAANTADQGSGNYGNYPLFIGSRNNANFFFNGNIYSLIVVGKAVDTSQIEAIEQWINAKMGTTLLPIGYNSLTTAGGDQLTTAAGDPLYTFPIYP